jgi:adenine-specific DNA-methyltransferase
MKRVNLLDHADGLRREASRKLDVAERAVLGQFFTPASVARLMASMFELRGSTLSLLDAGAGAGVLSAAWVSELCARTARPEEVSITAYEVDPSLVPYLRRTLDQCRRQCRRAGIRFRADVRERDFIREGVGMLRESLLHAGEQFDCAILNPPYRKINADSETRRLLRLIGVETSNLYTGFVAIAAELLRPGGELVAITPRSFCNGPYFKPFRKHFLATMTFRRIHLYESRDRAFEEDDVLQENVLFHALKTRARSGSVVISSSNGPDDPHCGTRSIPLEELVYPDDPERFIRIVPDEPGKAIAARVARLQATLADLGVEVSTGRVVDFRARPFLRAREGAHTVPLVYPAHLRNGFVSWPNSQTKKPNAIVEAPATAELLIPSETYVVVKRFSSKEERRRVVAAVYDAARISASRVGFENHLNYYHRNGRGLAPVLARGLAGFLNSTLVDAYFRQFSGHTQVNATDLRTLRYPARTELEALGRSIGGEFPDPDTLDRLLDQALSFPPYAERLQGRGGQQGEAHR